MNIEEFIAKFIEQQDAGLRQAVYAFLGYATVAVGGLLYVYKEYINKNKNERKDVPNSTWLLFGAFAFAALACFSLTYKFDGRKNFCTVWLPAKEAELKRDCIGKRNRRLIRCSGGASKSFNSFVGHRGQTRKDGRSATDEKLISNFLADYYGFDMGKRVPKHIKKYLIKKELTGWSKPSTLFQKEWLGIVIFFFVLLSVDFYTTALRRLCLKEPSAPCLLQTLYRWLYETKRGGR